MPDNPHGKEDFGHEKKKSSHKFGAVGTEEELGDMHLSTENYSVALEYYERALQKIHLSPHPPELLRIYRKISDCYSKKGLLREAMTFLQSAESHHEETDEFGKGRSRRRLTKRPRRTGCSGRATNTGRSRTRSCSLRTAICASETMIKPSSSSPMLSLRTGASRMQSASRMY